jgi:putative oxidoreductase
MNRNASKGRGKLADLSLLALRVGAGSLLAGHGAQKLFGLFEGHGLEGTAGFLGSLGLRPPKQWAALSGISEFGGGSLLALGLGGPIGPILMQGAMVTAIRQVHWKFPLFVTSNGAELPIIYTLIGATIAATGPGRYSLDDALDIQIPRPLTLAAAAAVGAGIALSEYQIAQAKRNATPTEEEDSKSGSEAASAEPSTS